MVLIKNNTQFASDSVEAFVSNISRLCLQRNLLSTFRISWPNSKKSNHTINRSNSHTTPPFCPNKIYLLPVWSLHVVSCHGKMATSLLVANRRKWQYPRDLATFPDVRHPTPVHGTHFVWTPTLGNGQTLMDMFFNGQWGMTRTWGGYLLYNIESYHYISLQYLIAYLDNE